MRIAVIGGGVSGLVAARLLATQHDVHLFEAGNYAGGHANTVDVIIGGKHFSVDTGFMVFNERTYPNFARLLELLGVAAQASDMSFSVSCESSGLEYQGSSLKGLFAQRRNLLRPRFYRMLADIVRFNRAAQRFVACGDADTTVREFLDKRQLGTELRDHYLLPMTAAIWSCPPDNVLGFPARFLLQFMQNHGLLQLTDRPQWLTIPGGSRSYVQALTAGMEQHVHLNRQVSRIARHNDGVSIEFIDRQPELFDAAVLATHADVSLSLLRDADPLERELLAAFPYQRNEAVLHTDESWLPRSRAAWASWNYRLTTGDDRRVCVTYDLSRLQKIDSPRRLLVTLNPPTPVKTEYVLRQFTYHHPVFSTQSTAAQARWAEINGIRQTYFCGAYWRHGFHEDGVVSALNVAQQFGLGLTSCTAPCIKETSSTYALAP